MYNVSSLFLFQENQSIEYMCFSEIFLVDSSKKPHKNKDKKTQKNHHHQLI